MVTVTSVGVSLPTAPQYPSYYLTTTTGTSTKVIYKWEAPEDDGCTITGTEGVIGYTIVHGTDLNNLSAPTYLGPVLMWQPTYTLGTEESSYFKVAAVTTYTNSIVTELGGVYTDLKKVTFVTHTETVKVRGTATNAGYIDFYFTARTGDGTYIQLDGAFWRLTDNTAPISANSNIYSIEDLINEEILTPGCNVFKNGITGTAVSGYSPGWPTLVNSVSVEPADDVFGESIKIIFTLDDWPYVNPGGVSTTYGWDVNVSMVAPTNSTSSTGLDGMGAFLVATDYTTDVSFYKQGSTAVQDADFMVTGTGYLIWTVNSSIVYNPYLNKNENTPLTSKEFTIPIFAHNDLLAIADMVANGDGGTVGSLEDQINDYFLGTDIDPAIQQLYIDADPVRPFIVSTEVIAPGDSADGKGHLKVNIKTMVEGIQNQITCRTVNLKAFYLATRANTYYVNDMMYELRSFEDMYGRNKPGSTTLTEGYVKRSYGFKFNLDYIKEYTEDETSSIDVTTIPGMSSGNTIGLDTSGTQRTISITGVRVDNSNYWMFHAPFEYVDNEPTSLTRGDVLQGGVIYMGTSNWGWCKFMKAVMGTFQFIDGPYRLIIMSIPSSLMQQYVPDRYCKYQYPDGTYIVQAGTEDMCYVMIEKFTTTKDAEMFNAMSYVLLLRRVVALGSST